MILFTFIAIFAFGKKGLNCRFEKLLLAGDMDTWAEVVDSLQKLDLSDGDDFILLYAEYGLTAYLLANERDDEGKEVLDKFIDHVDGLLREEADNADYHAFKAASYGFEIALSPWKAPFYSLRHHNRVEKAIALRKHEILPFIEKANSLYFRPSFVGGNKSKALEYYLKGNELLKLDRNCNWVYYNNSAWLAQVYTKLGQAEKARKIYLRLLDEAPDFHFVKNELLPQLERGEFKDIQGGFEKMLNLDH